MLDIGWGEMLLLALLALLVLGPRELPGFLRMLGGLWQRLRIQLFTLRQNFSLMDLPADWQPQMEIKPEDASGEPAKPGRTARAARRRPSRHGAPDQKH